MNIAKKHQYTGTETTPSIRQRRLALERAKISANHKSIRDGILAALVWLVGTAIFIWIGYAI